MRILLAMSLVGANTGVPGKIKGMMDALKRNGHEAAFLPLSDSGHASKSFASCFAAGCAVDFERLNRNQKIRCISETIQRFEPDIVYYRYDGLPTHLLGLLRAGVPFVEEHNTIEWRERRLKGGVRPLLREALFGFFFRRAAVGLVGMTQEILQYELKIAGKEKPGLVLPNTMPACELPVGRSLPKNREMVCVAYFDEWHGVDRLVALMRHQEMSSFRLYLVGSGPALRPLMDTIGATPNISLVGQMAGRELDALLRRCDVGIGALAIHRNGMKEACPLKVRRYLMMGLPVMVGYRDPDLKGDLPFVLRVPPDESPIDPAYVTMVFNRIASDPAICQKAHAHALKHMETGEGMKRLVEFFEAVLARSGSQNGRPAR